MQASLKPEAYNFNSWREELLFTGNIVQDGDNSVSSADREHRFKRYIQILDAITGLEGMDAFVALVDSLQAKEDYGAYQSTYCALRRFPAKVAAQGLIVGLPPLIHRQRDCAGDILAQLANATSHENLALLSAFRKELELTSAPTRTMIMDFVTQEENGGWLDGRRKGVIRSTGN